MVSRIIQPILYMQSISETEDGFNLVENVENSDADNYRQQFFAMLEDVVAIGALVSSEDN